MIDTKLAIRLHAMADRMQAQIKDKERPMTQNPTPRRMRMYQSRLHEAANLKRCQKALHALAQAHEAGTVPPALAGIKTKKAVCPLVATRWASTGYYEGHDSREYWDDSEAGKALQTMIIGTPDEEAEAGRLNDLQRAEAKAKLMIGNTPGFFPTPRAVAKQMIDLAGICDGHAVLEPSAGSGSIADAILARCPGAKLWCIELNYGLQELLRLKGHLLIHSEEGGDFMCYPTGARYDRIVMNPPFEQRQDIDHVLHAYACLKPGGRLVAVMSEGTFFANGKPSQFRDWLEDEPSYWYDVDLPSDAFRESGTGVKTRLIVIEKGDQLEIALQKGELSQGDFFTTMGV